jgi:hypothetical protein
VPVSPRAVAPKLLRSQPRTLYLTMVGVRRTVVDITWTM